MADYGYTKVQMDKAVQYAIFILLALIFLFLLKPSASKSKVDSSSPLKEFEMADFDTHANYLLPFVQKAINKSSDFVLLKRFYSEKNLSYATSPHGLEGIIRTLSEQGQEISGYTTSAVPMIAWKREWYREMYFIEEPTGKYPGNFKKLNEVVTKVEKEAKKQGHRLKAARFHTYMSHCKMMEKVGNPGDLSLPVLLTTRLEESAGHFSVDVPNKTCVKAKSFDADRNQCLELVTEKEALAGCWKTKSFNDYKTLLNSDKILLILTSQHQAFFHKKILSLPLGVRPEMAGRIAGFLQESDGSLLKERLVAVYNSDRGYEKLVNQHFLDVFGAGNSFKTTEDSLSVQERRRLAAKSKKISPRSYLQELASAKFYVSPPGLGYDTHGIWEALSLGSIPIVEASPTGPGLERAFSLLPVLVVKDLTKVSVRLLVRAYSCFVKHADKWRYDLLTQDHWDGLILTAMSSGNIDHIVRDHPERNPYCNFLEETK